VPESTRRVLIVAGVHASPWHLQSWCGLGKPYEVSVLLSPRNVFGAADVPLPVVPVRTIGERFPGRAPGGLIRRAFGDRYLRLEDHLRGADIVHTYELGSWFAAQAASLRSALGFRLAVTTWETIAWGAAQRSRRARRYRAAVLEAADLFMPTTQRARDALLLEGVAPERMVVNPPGIDVDRFAPARNWLESNEGPVILSVGRLVPEKGHADVLEAVALLRSNAKSAATLVIVGEGPDEARLRALAARLGIERNVRFEGGVGYEDMPRLYQRASCLVLASKKTAAWEEQYGMVLAEAMAGWVPVVASASGAIPEVVGDCGTLFSPGDRVGLASAIEEVLAAGPGVRRPPTPERGEEMTLSASAARLRAAYDALLAG
jgi:glycosyltransferase involved in cell wall biosynthesis